MSIGLDLFPVDVQCRSLGLLLVLTSTFLRSSEAKTTVFLPSENEPIVDTQPHDVSNGNDAKMTQLWHYIHSVFPPVYDTHRSIWSSIYDELITYHPYITVFNWADACSAREKMTTAVYLLTVQSMLMFLMAVFMDLDVSIPL